MQNPALLPACGNVRPIGKHYSKGRPRHKGSGSCGRVDYHYAYTIKDSKEPLLAYAICLAYLALFWWLGYFASTPIFLIALMRYLKAGSWKKIIIITIIYTVIIYIMFVPVLGLPIHRVGLLGDLFRFK